MAGTHGQLIPVNDRDDVYILKNLDDAMMEFFASAGKVDGSSAEEDPAAQALNQ